MLFVYNRTSPACTGKMNYISTCGAVIPLNLYIGFDSHSEVPTEFCSRRVIMAQGLV